MVGHLIFLSLSVVITFLSLAIVRVGLVGEHLDRFHLVSYVKKSNEQPKLYNRYITSGLGILFLLVGTVLFGFEIFFISKLK
jgi:hypothetical protein